ncbi:MAG: nucleotidyltransferase [Acidobacteriota bacterium]|nr:nucleotidyltransferase [Acidobacteriota bacterium]
MPEPTFEEMIDAMKDAVAVLQARDIPFVLGGGLAAWARGGPRSEHDVDLLIREQDAEDALAAYEEAGMRVECPPEGWLVKAWHPNGTLVDLIYSPAGGPITDDTLERAPEIEVMALRLRVSSLEDLMTTKLLALNEQEPGFGSVLELARALREQIEWDDVRRRTSSSPFARAFFTLVEGLGVVEPSHEKVDGPPEGGPYAVQSAVWPVDSTTG